MRSPTDLRVLVGGLVIVLAACTQAAPSSSPSAAPSETGDSPASIPAASPTTADSGLALPEPGQPVDAATLLEGMRTSTRPDGVPDALQTDAIAERLAEAIWTFDGEGWSTTAISGSCGSASCTVEVAGSRTDGVGEDLWVFGVDPSTADVSVVNAELRALPEDLVGDLDALARAKMDSDELDDLVLTTARWLPPPDEGSFALSYRSGGEEGSCAAELTVDARAGNIEDEDYTNC